MLILFWKKQKDLAVVILKRFTETYPICDDSLKDFQDRRVGASLRYRNRAKTPVLMWEQKPHL